MRTSILASAALVLLAAGVSAQTSYPMITHVTPVAVQRGKTTTVVVAGQQNFAGTDQALFEGSGITAEVVAARSKSPRAGAVTLRLNVAAEAALGVREFRVVSNLGIS